MISLDHKFPVVIERRSHPFPFRTRQLSSASPMILRGQLRGKVGRRRDNMKGPRAIEGLSLYSHLLTMPAAHTRQTAPPTIAAEALPARPLTARRTPSPTTPVAMPRTRAASSGPEPP